MTEFAPITISTASNGELLFEGLREGVFPCASCLVDDVIELSNDGRFWPYEAEVVARTRCGRISFVRMKEVGN